jgi:hypothetical protein
MKASQTLAYVESHLEDISAQDIGRCSRVIGPDEKSFYLVLSRTDDFTEHKVTYDKEHGFRCTCPSGEHGFANVKHPSGVCHHVRSAIAVSIEERTALAAMTERRNEGARLRHAASLPAVSIPEPIEVRWSIPAWMPERPVAPHMKQSPKER